MAAIVKTKIYFVKIVKSFKPIESICIKCICICLAVFLLIGQPAYAAATADDEANLQYLQGIVDMIRDQYQGSFTDKQLVEGAVDGMLNSLDDYTTYYTPEEADSFMGTITGAFGGIGVTMEPSGNYVLVTEVFTGSPAEKAGILQGDKIIEADGKNLIKATTDQAASLIRGEVGTVVKLGLLRNNSNIIKYVDVTRSVIKVNPVTFEIKNGIGCIKLEMFNENTDEFITAALAEMDRNRITKLILDLRDNPGGEVGQAVAVAQKFVPKGLITRLDYKSEKYQDLEYRSNLEKQKYKLAVLVNSMSASASEIVSGAIQDTGAGKLIGTKTFGKAKFQGLLPILSPEAFLKYQQLYGVNILNGLDLQMYFGIIPSEDEIAGYTKMTLGLYYTPKGRMIDGTGLVPDIPAEDPKPVSGVYINSIRKLSNTTKPGLNFQGTDVYNAEMLLKALGYRISMTDNTLDEQTVKAIREYQKKSGFGITGILDTRTQNALNSDLASLVSKHDNQYNAAVQYLNQ